MIYIATLLFAVLKVALAANITWSTLSNVKIFGPGSGYTAPGVLYGRTAIIGDTLFATAENCEQSVQSATIERNS